MATGVCIKVTRCPVLRCFLQHPSHGRSIRRQIYYKRMVPSLLIGGSPTVPPSDRRTLFNLPKLPDSLLPANEVIRFRERLIVGHKIEELYSVVADVDRYHEFLPWCRGSVVTSRSPKGFKADMVLGFPALSDSYTSNVTLIRPSQIKAECSDSKLFNSMVTIWTFGPGVLNNSRSCSVEFDGSVQFRSIVHQKLIGLFMEEGIRKMSAAFLKRAEVLYGKSSMKTQQIHYRLVMDR